jgi:hypothetical protein
MLYQEVAPARFGEAAVLGAAIVVLTAVGILGYRRGRRPWLWVATVGYNLLLVSVYTIGLLYDRGDGPITFIAVGLTMPWASIMPVDPLAQWLLHVQRTLPGFDTSLALLVGWFGAFNTLCIWLAVRVFVYPGCGNKAEGPH